MLVLFVHVMLVAIVTLSLKLSINLAVVRDYHDDDNDGSAGDVIDD